MAASRAVLVSLLSATVGKAGEVHTCPAGVGSGQCDTSAKSIEGGACFNKGSAGVQCLPDGVFKDYRCPSELPTKCMFESKVCPSWAVAGHCDMNSKGSQTGACYNPDHKTGVVQCLPSSLFDEYACPNSVPIKCFLVQENSSEAVVV